MGNVMWPCDLILGACSSSLFFWQAAWLVGVVLSWWRIARGLWWSGNVFVGSSLGHRYVCSV